MVHEIQPGDKRTDRQTNGQRSLNNTVQNPKGTKAISLELTLTYNCFSVNFWIKANVDQTVTAIIDDT